MISVIETANGATPPHVTACEAASVALDDKVAFLSAPQNHPEAPARVELVQTHNSFVFLTRRFAYKMKKPVRYDFLDFSTLEARKRDCDEEVRLNRRLAGSVYLGVVPLTLMANGALQLGGTGAPVEWLVKMRRLPRQLMMDQAIAAGSVSLADIRRVTALLADFYRRAAPAGVDVREYCARFERDIAANARELAGEPYGVARDELNRLTAAQLAFLRSALKPLAARVSSGKIVEGHGDLRPEHVCLARKPVIIDCLEFNRDLRIVDTADELAYLALECEVIGAPATGDSVLACYAECSGDHPPPALTQFYRAYRATLRAKLSAWHLAEITDTAARRKWLDRTHAYLSRAARYAALL